MLKCNRLILLIVLTLSVFLLQSSLLAQEVNENFQNLAIDPQTGIFLATFTATPTVGLVDGVLGLSETEPDDYGDYSCKILFNNAGYITASNGTDFEAAAEVPYSGGTAYTCKVLVNILDQNYSVWVTPAGGDEVVIGESFAFAPSAGVVDSINWRSVKMSFGAPWGGAEGTVTVADFNIGLPDEMNVNTAFEPQDGKFMVDFDAHPTVSAVDGVIGFSKDMPSGWSEPIKVLFNNEGKFVARNGSSYEALNDFSYTGGMSYHVRMVVDIPMQTYDVWIAPAGGAEVAIGKDNAFDGEADTLQWRTVIMSFDPQWGGAEGIVEITNFMISDAPDDKLSCVLVTTSYPDRKIWDAPLIAYLEEKFNLTKVTDDTIMNGFFTMEQLVQFDLCVVSESCSDWRLAAAPKGFFKTAPIPMFRTDNWSSEAEIFGWVTPEGTWGTISDSSGNGGKVYIIDDTNHPLSAGFEFGSEVEITTGTDEEDELGILTYCMPTVDHIAIAVSSENPDWVVVAGVEAGTTVWNNDGTVLDVSDSTVTQNRVAVVGLYSRAYPYITQDGYKLLDAGINWVLNISTNIENPVSAVPDKFELVQNFPNPFNPSTTIKYDLTKSGEVSLQIYNILGERVATLYNGSQKAGTYTLVWQGIDSRGRSLPSGIYICQLRTDYATKSIKMMLLK
jgi:hypothetical protein